MYLNKTSIIIPTYNNLEYTIKCVDSIRKFTEEDSYEIIIVDNNSKDGTKDWLLSQKDLTVVLNDENLGFPIGCNIGIEKSNKGNDILLLNNDVVVTKNWITNLKRALYKRDDIGAVGPLTNYASDQYIEVDYKNMEEMQRFAENFNKYDEDKHRYKLKLIGFCMLIKREVVNSIGGLDNIYTPGNYEDDDYCFTMLTKGYKVMLSGDTFVHHEGSKSFSKNPKMFNEVSKMNYNKINKKWNFIKDYVTIARSDLFPLLDKDLNSNPRILEIGCACGATLVELKNMYKDCELYGIEENESCARIASGYANIIKGDVGTLEMPYEEDFFHIIICADIIEHLKSPQGFIRNIKNFLKEDGSIIFSLPNIMHYTVIKGLLNGNFSYEDSGILDKTHLRFFTFKEIEKILNSCDLSIDYIIEKWSHTDNEIEEFVHYISKVNPQVKNQFYVYQYLLRVKKA